LLAQVQGRAAGSGASLSSRVAELEREVQQLRTRLRALEMRDPHTPPPSGTSSDALSFPLVAPAPSVRISTPKPPGGHYSALQGQSSPDASGDFRFKAHAAAWLATHGPAAATVNGWEEVKYNRLPLSRRAFLEAAIRRKHGTDEPHKIWWPLHECADPDCPCHQMLPAP
jgi:hypothetical protein